MRAFHIAFKDVRVWTRDIAALGVLLGMPLVLIFILGSALGGQGGDFRIRAAIVNLDAGTTSPDPAEPRTSSKGITTDLGGEMVTTFKESDRLNKVFEMTYEPDEARARSDVSTGRLAAVLVVPEDFSERVSSGKPAALKVYTDPGSQLAAGIFEGVVRSFASEYSAASVGVQTVLAVARQVDPGRAFDPRSQAQLTQAALESAMRASKLVVVKDAEVKVGAPMSAISYYAVSMTAMFLMFGAMFGAFSTIKERREQTLSRLLSTPTSGAAVTAGKMMGIFVLGMAQFTVLYLSTRFIFRVEWGDDIAAIFLIAAAELLAVTGLAVLIASLARTERGAGGLAPLVIQIQALLGGAFFAITILPVWLQPVRYFSIVGWALEGWQTIQIRGGGVPDVLGPAAALLGFALVFFAIGSALTGARR